MLARILQAVPDYYNDVVVRPAITLGDRLLRIRNIVSLDYVRCQFITKS